MVKIRLKRIGAKKNPFYRIVVADSRYPRNVRRGYLEHICQDLQHLFQMICHWILHKLQS